MIKFIKTAWQKLAGIFRRESPEEKKIRQQLEKIEENDPFIYK